MILGAFRDGHPRLTLSLPCRIGLEETEFIVDTGFEGDLAVPDEIARQLDAQSSGSVIRLLADGSPFRCPVLEVVLSNEVVSRTVEVLVLAGNPLLGTVLLREYLLHIEMAEGGELAAEPL